MDAEESSIDSHGLATEKKNLVRDKMAKVKSKPFEASESKEIKLATLGKVCIEPVESGKCMMKQRHGSMATSTST